MDPETIVARLRVAPFQPFRIFLSDGSSYVVKHPEMMIVGRRQITIAVALSKKGVARDVVLCAPIHVTRIEPIPA